MVLLKLLVTNNVSYLEADASEIKFYASAGKKMLELSRK